MQVSSTEINILMVLLTVVFLIAPVFLLLYLRLYIRRKKIYIQEKQQMKLSFEAEIAKTQLEVQEQTMQTIGADLHDNIGQLLSLTSLTLNSIELDNQPKARQKIDDSIDLTVRSIKEMRLLGHLLQGDQLVALGLAEAIQRLVNWMERSGRYEIVFTTGDEMPANGNADKDLIIFRITQEIFNNIIKHAGATRITVSLDYDEGLLKLIVNDDGMGFKAETLPLVKHGMGLQNIRKRAAIIGGEASISSDPGEGTRVTVTVPYC
jgi:two-component system NarL family sensor kinase